MKRRTFWVLAATVCVVLMALGVVAGQVVFASWQQSHEVAAKTVGVGEVGLSVTEYADAGGQAGVPTVVAGSGLDNAAAVTLNAAHAQAMITNASHLVMIPFQVESRADGNMGMEYTFALSDADGATVAGQSSFELTRVGSISQCAPALLTNPSYNPMVLEPGEDSSRVAAVSTSYGVNKGAIHNWCLVAHWDENALGVIENTATVTGTGPTGLVAEDSDSWSARLTPAVTGDYAYEIKVAAQPIRPTSGG
jgi:hypothetical protein